ncbi:type II toxin-antitoxin system VapC family toxin [Humibacter sp.]|jgi:PIN domain nuclease of toxin-antitoxin system|uniref:type II toxin-antitoxin system VapC family toxin n=1 Tax=Humibacter sp. TaxID=1940291 RepID=UPI003F81D8C7
MKYLLDTHLLIWASADDSRLSPRARELLEEPDNSLLFSAASIWEISIKNGLGRPSFQFPSAVFRRGLIEAGYLELDITSAHAVAVGQLPRIHSDPFDRMLVAQARTEGYPLLTSDKRVAEYGSPAVLV